nr:28 kDa heat- and acid-stable phosphoprotein-like [Saimiri boliviensis boliviensis]
MQQVVEVTGKRQGQVKENDLVSSWMMRKLVMQLTEIISEGKEKDNESLRHVAEQVMFGDSNNLLQNRGVGEEEGMDSEIKSAWEKGEIGNKILRGVRGAAAAAAGAALPKGGRKGGHEGRARQYTSPEEIDAQLQAEKQKAREEEEQKEGGDGAAGDPKKEKKSLDSDDSEDEEDDYQQKHKGVEGLIDIENPNRVAQTTKKFTQLDLDGPKELSRREREEIEKQKVKERYMKMHLAGKTEQAKADLARLAIIWKQQKEAARKKEEERKAKDDATLSGKRMQSLSLNQ